jgi:hypothetical protein
MDAWRKCSGWGVIHPSAANERCAVRIRGTRLRSKGSSQQRMYDSWSGSCSKKSSSGSSRVRKKLQASSKVAK